MRDPAPLRIALAAVLSTAVLAVGCHTTATIGSANSGGTGDSGVATGGSEGTTGGSAPDAGGSGGGSGGWTTTDDWTWNTDDGPTWDDPDWPPPVCEPRPDDHECVRCAKEYCCYDTFQCIGHPPCECLLDCVDRHEPWHCPQMCPPSPEGMALLGCLAYLCQEECV